MSNRLGAFLLLGSIVVNGSCGGDGGDSGVVQAAETLLRDDFSSGNLNNWVVQAGSVTVDSLSGNPLPSMSVGAGGSAKANIDVFVSSGATNAYTFSSDARTTTSTTTGAINIIRKDATDPTPNTFVSFTSTSATFSINGEIQTVTFTGDAMPHTYTFSVEKNLGTWTRETGERFSAAYAPSSLVHLQVKSDADFTLFDNVTISARH